MTQQILYNREVILECCWSTQGQGAGAVSTHNTPPLCPPLNENQATSVTLFLSFNSLQPTFIYYSEYWSNTIAYNEAAGTTLNDAETKLSSFWSTPFNRLCLGMKYPKNGETNWIALNYNGSSLRDVIGNGIFQKTNVNVTEWKSLLKNSEIQVKSKRSNNCHDYALIP